MSFTDTDSLRAFIVCVDYSDILSVTLPYNLHHFDSVYVITASHDLKTRRLAESLDCGVLVTDVFYKDNAIFNKFRALELGLDVFGRYGWIALLDADILWPKVAPLDKVLQVGRLCSPIRRMFTHEYPPGQFVIPPEHTWQGWPIHRNVNEHAGYTQIFNCADPVLGDAPWHQIDWSHAGGADSFFQAKWHPDKKVRPTWEVLHIGEAGCNWMGRASRDILTGEIPEDAAKKKQAYLDIWPQRRQRQREKLDPFTPEKIVPKDT